jgi:hypothetical protein
MTGQDYCRAVNVGVGNAGLADNIGDERDEAVAVLPARYRCAAAGVFLACVAALAFFLAGADTPEMADCFGEPRTPASVAAESHKSGGPHEPSGRPGIANSLQKRYVTP